jgi:hypothetical protein
MNKKPKYLNSRNPGLSLWMTLLVLLFAQGGCTSIDDNQDCFALARLRLVWTRNTTGIDRIREQVESVDLYVYKQSDSTLVTTKRFSKTEMISYNYSLPLDWLNMGDYHVVIFGNKSEDYTHLDHEHMGTLRLAMVCSDGNGLMTDNPCHFFHGTVSLRRFDDDTKTVEMAKSTNNINIYIQNRIPATRAVEGLPDLEISIVAKNGSIKHDHSIAEDDSRIMTHISNNKFPQYSQTFKVTHTVGRLFQRDGSRLVIKNTDTGQILVSENLSDRIVTLANESPRWEGTDPDLYLEIQDEHDLYYTVEMKFGVLVVTEVTIDDWNTVNNPVGGV